MTTPNHSRVAPGSLVLLSPSDNLRNIPRHYLAADPARASSRLKSAATCVIAADPAHMGPIIAYARRWYRPVVIADDVAPHYSLVDPRPRVLPRNNMSFLANDGNTTDYPTVVFGDLHHCWRTYEAFKEAAYERFGKNTLLASVGDLFDKGGSSPYDAVLTAKKLMDDQRNGHLIIASGNHDATLAARLDRILANVDEIAKNTHRTPRAILSEGTDFATEVMHWLRDLPLFVRIGSTVVVHAAWDPQLAQSAPASRQMLEMCLYGPRPTDGRPRFDERGHLTRVEWAGDYKGTDSVVHGHYDYPQPLVTGNVVGIDTDCVNGGGLSGYLVGADPQDPRSFITVATDPLDMRSTNRE